ncbi:MAG: hypothetical protein IJQ01_07790 [Selenomonadaceae bacterium]|nr:hypothetical protein [Selenomonadaceae bacterium]
MPDDVLALIRRAKKELPDEFVAYPLDSGMPIEDFRRDLQKRLATSEKKFTQGEDT